jgi:hypothetical protein
MSCHCALGLAALTLCGCYQAVCESSQCAHDAAVTYDAGNFFDAGATPIDGGHVDHDAGTELDDDGGSCTLATLDQSAMIFLRRDVEISGQNYIASARFLPYPISATVPSCPGRCSSSIGRMWDGGVVDMGPDPVSAGTLMLKNLSTGVQMPIDSFMGQGVQYFSGNAVWTAGDSLQAIASGDIFPAFAATIHSPANLAGANPAFVDGPVVIARGSPFTVSWTPSSAPAGTWVQLSLIGPDGAVSCFEEDSVGSITMPASITARLAVGTQVYGVTLQRRVDVVDRSTGRNISVTAASSLYAPGSVVQ